MKNETAQIGLTSYIISFLFLGADKQLLESQLLKSQLLELQLLNM
jgi:hypothetical protein